MFQHTFILRRPRVATSTNIIKIVTMFIETILNDSKKLNRIRNYVTKYNPFFYFLI